MSIVNKQGKMSQILHTKTSLVEYSSFLNRDGLGHKNTKPLLLHPIPDPSPIQSD